MSIDWNVRLDTNPSAKEVLGIAAKRLSAEIKDDREPFSFRVHESLVIASDGKNLSEIGKRLMKESYNLDLKVNVTFADYRGKVSQAEQDNRIGKGIATILKEVEGDAIVLFDGEITVAQRINDELILAEKEYEWLEEEFKELGLRYRRRPLISPFIAPQVEETQAA